MVSPDLDAAPDRRWLAATDASTSPSSNGAMMIVADGMGGYQAGEVAARIAVETICTYFDRIARPVETTDHVRVHLLEAVTQANQAIVNHAELYPEVAGMGTTVVVAWLIDLQLHIAWVGDSRAYLLRPDHPLRQLTTDHSLVQELVDQGKITREQAFYHPESHLVTQSLGGDDRAISPDYVLTPLLPGDRILLCSDGLNSMLQDSEIEAVLLQHSELTAAGQTLIQRANEAGGADNITVCLLDVAQPAPAIATAGATTINPWRRLLYYRIMPLTWLLLLATAALYYWLLLQQQQQAPELAPRTTQRSAMAAPPLPTPPPSRNISPQPAEPAATSPDSAARPANFDYEAFLRNIPQEAWQRIRAGLDTFISTQPATDSLKADKPGTEIYSLVDTPATERCRKSQHLIVASNRLLAGGHLPDSDARYLLTALEALEMNWCELCKP